MASSSYCITTMHISSDRVCASEKADGAFWDQVYLVKRQSLIEVKNKKKDQNLQISGNIAAIL